MVRAIARVTLRIEVMVTEESRLAHPPVPERLAGLHRPGWNCGANMGRWASSGHFGSIKNSAHGKRKAVFIFFARRGDFHGRMAVRGNAALGRAGNLFIGPLSLALRARLIVEIVQNILGTHPQCVC